MINLNSLIQTYIETHVKSNPSDSEDQNIEAFCRLHLDDWQRELGTKTSHRLVKDAQSYLAIDRWENARSLLWYAYLGATSGVPASFVALTAQEDILRHYVTTLKSLID